VTITSLDKRYEQEYEVFDDFEEGEVDQGLETPRNKRRLSLDKINALDTMEVMLDEKAEEKERSRLKGPRMRDGKE
jgi:hypothetical protein